VQRADVRTIQRGDGVRVAFEAFDPLVLLERMAWKDLDGSR